MGLARHFLEIDGYATFLPQLACGTSESLKGMANFTFDIRDSVAHPSQQITPILALEPWPLGFGPIQRGSAGSLAG